MAARRIMVVEDEAIVAFDIQTKLEEKGYEIPAVLATGEDAVVQAGELMPDLILMDIHLAGEMDGTEAAEQIHRLYDIPVVYLTAFSDSQTLERAKGAAPFGYMLKPFEEKKLHTTIEIALYKKEADREKDQLKAQLSQARKMEAIGRLTAGLAYHFTNVLQGIQGNIDLAMLRASDDLRPYLDSADYDAQRAAHIIKRLLAFYQRENVDLNPVAPAELVEEVGAACREVFARNQRRALEFDVEVDGELGTILGDASQLRQGISNLCTNARDALEALPKDDPRTARIQLTAYLTQVDEPQRDAYGKATAGHFVCISVSDNGIGIDPEIKEQLFEPFFSSSDTGLTGLGLSTLYTIVSEHNGWLTCDSTIGQGTTVSVYLPVFNEDESPAETSLEHPEIITSDDTIFDTESLRGSEKVLLIADVDRARRVLSEMLEYHDYEVLVGFDARDGINLFEMAHSDIHLVVLDLSQNSHSAHEILAQVLAIKSDARVLVTTGYTHDSAPWTGARAVLNKPFKTHHLLRTVRRIIDETPDHPA